jgi:hypothetical protein
MCEKLKKLDSLDLIKTKLNQQEVETKGVKSSITKVNEKIQEVEKSMDLMNTEFEKNKRQLKTL